MNIVTIGRGNIGNGLATLWTAAGHTVTMLGRDGGDAGNADVLLVAVPGTAIADAMGPRQESPSRCNPGHRGPARGFGHRDGRNRSYLGEGFDWPELDTLFLAFPIAFKERLPAYATLGFDVPRSLG